MFDNYKEIIWLINIMNMNDRRGIIKISDVFDAKGLAYEDEQEKQGSKRFMYIAGSPGSGKSACILEAALRALIRPFCSES